MILLDTNIIIGYQYADADIVSWVDAERRRATQFAISPITFVELFGYAKLTTVERSSLELLMSSLVVSPVDLTVARFAAKFRVDYKLSTVDSVIAATAFVLGAPICTRDKAFKKCKPISVIVP